MQSQRDPEQERRNAQNMIRGHAAFNDGDVEAALQYLSPDLELHPGIGGALTGETVYRGHDGFRRYMADITEAFEDLRVEPQTIATCGEWVVSEAKVSGHGRASQVDFATDMTVVWRSRDGEAIWGATYFQRADALKAIGLTEGELTPPVV
jgi:ketosteroid isomerase-like protein